MWQETLADQLRAELNAASAEYAEAKTAFGEVLDEMRRVNPADADSLLRLALAEYNRAFELYRVATRRYADFVMHAHARRTA